MNRMSRSGWIPAPCCLPLRHPGHAMRFPGSESRACRRVSRFPVPALGSAGSATGRPALFVGFTATMAECDFSRPFIAGYGSSPSRHGPARRRSRPAGHETSRFPKYRELTHMPGSPTTPDQTDARGDASRLFCLPQRRQRRHPEIILLSRLNGWPMRTPTDASDLPSRTSTHGSGTTWFATPSSQWTFTFYSLPVSPAPPTPKNN
jgi:hypothetical protein